MALNLKMAQVAARNTIAKYGYGSKWSDIYGTEEELLKDIIKIHVPSKDDHMKIVSHSLYKSCDFIHGVAKAAQSGNVITDSQMTACKRCALQIKLAAEISKHYET